MGQEHHMKSPYLLPQRRKLKKSKGTYLGICCHSSMNIGVFGLKKI
jgi:hypothetical protein